MIRLSTIMVVIFNRYHKKQKLLTKSQLPSTCLNSNFKSLILEFLSLSVYLLMQVVFPISVTSGLLITSVQTFFLLRRWHNIISNNKIATKQEAVIPPDMIRIRGKLSEREAFCVILQIAFNSRFFYEKTMAKIFWIGEMCCMNAKVFSKIWKRLENLHFERICNKRCERDIKRHDSTTSRFLYQKIGLTRFQIRKSTNYPIDLLLSVLRLEMNAKLTVSH